MPYSHCNPEDMDPVQIASLIMAYRELHQRERRRAALAASVIDRVKDIMDACTVARIAAELAASELLSGA